MKRLGLIFWRSSFDRLRMSGRETTLRSW